MKILTSKKQRQIEKNRDIIYCYIRNNVGDDHQQMGEAIEALADISCDCGVWSNPPQMWEV